jgi:FMN phosphatase YigB (HAD superfamily)
VKIQAILFDLGKVIIDFTFSTAVEALHSSCSISRAELEELLWDEAWIRRYERGEITASQFHEYLCRTAKLGMEFPQFCQTWSSVFLPGTLISEELLASLKKRYPLILVSNTNQLHVEHLRATSPVFEYFDHLIFSHEVGSLKPDAKIFKAAIAVSGFPPEALFFTDDREENVVAARQLGMHAHQFVSQAALIEALRAAGVEVGDIVHRDPLLR